MGQLGPCPPPSHVPPFLLLVGSEPNLLVRACNQLGQFLQHRETNLRYLALESMCTLASSEFSHEAVKTHIDTVINALKVRHVGACPRPRPVRWPVSLSLREAQGSEAIAEPRTYRTCSPPSDGAGRQCATAGR